MLQLDPRLDPREWKKEHQVALAGAIALSCLVGLVIGLTIKERFRGLPDWSERLRDLFCGFTFMCYAYRQDDYFGILFWAVSGGLIVGSVVYITQLLRK
jgi:hypothetical protein